MVRTEKLMIDGTEYTLAYTPGCLQCAEDYGYDGITDMMADKKYEIRNILLIIEAMIKCGAYQDRKAGREAKTISLQDLRMCMSTSELTDAVSVLQRLQAEKPAVDAEVPKN